MIIVRLDEVFYTISIESSGKKIKVVQVNLLKPYLAQKLMLSITGAAEENEELGDNLVDVLAHFSEPVQQEELVWPASMSSQDRERLLSLLHQFEDVCIKEPERTNLAKYRIDRLSWAYLVPTLQSKWKGASKWSERWKIC